MPAGKGKGKTRGGGGAGGGARDALGGTSWKDSASNRRSRSRNTTPASTAMSENTLMSGELSLSPQLSYSDILDKYVLANDPSIPASVTLDALTKDLKALISSAAKQAEAYRARMAELTEQVEKKKLEEKERKEREEEEREKLERRRRDREERRAREGDRKKKDKDKDKHHHHGHTSKHPPTHGAHQLTSQAPDAVGDDKKNKKRKTDSPDDDGKGKKRSRSSSIFSTSSESDRQPSPLPPAIVYDYFENDDTVYYIEEVTPETSIEECRRIFQVADFPKVDLSDLQAGDPPDMDFTNAKPQNQVAHVTYTSYTDPYFRNFTEEDLAFLRERGDRVNCYIIPPLGPHYSEAWAQDETQTFASGAPPQLTTGAGPKGDPSEIGDEILEKEELSLGPLMSRILAGMVVEESAYESNDGTNGETNNDDNSNKKDQSSATTLPGHQDPSWKSANGKPNYLAIEEAMKRELKYFGLWEPNGQEPNWDEQQDDEVSARLRALQKELRKQSILNGARKARLTSMLSDQLAYQEYATILEDLDKQVEQAYTKRTRNFKPKKKKVVPNGAGVAQARLGIGDQARTLMERRKRWKETIAPVFDKDMTRIPSESIFNNLEELERIEEMGGPEEEA
ncbi:histone acetyltransferases subunit 3-domain-containing protein [Tirmania nivea]|nr:histone acetyltransferases subunit 3-domain-containing protein [Tirmania nivea]